MKSIIGMFKAVRSAAASIVLPRSSSTRCSSVKGSSIALIALLGAAALGSASSAHAAILRLYTYVPGYADRVRVISGSETGGRVVRHVLGYLYTDRVERGDLLILEATVDPNSLELPGDCVKIGIRGNSQPNPKYTISKEGHLPMTWKYNVPNDVAFRDVEAYARTDFDDPVEARIPIGPR